MVELSPVEDHPTVALVRRASHERAIRVQLGQGGLLRRAEVPRGEAAMRRREDGPGRGEQDARKAEDVARHQTRRRPTGRALQSKAAGAVGGRVASQSKAPLQLLDEVHEEKEGSAVVAGRRRRDEGGGAFIIMFSLPKSDHDYISCRAFKSYM